MTERAFTFHLPPDLNAPAPAERRGLRRDLVRLMVLDRATGATTHTRFNRLADYLRPGDVLVLNNSRTVPAVLKGRLQDGSPVEVRLAHRKDDHTWQALLISAAPLGVGTIIDFDRGLFATVTERRSDAPLSTLSFAECCLELMDDLYRLGEPVRYEYVTEPWDLEYYQTVYANRPGSVEMPSAGRAFTWQMLLDLKQRGIGVTFLCLHAGLSWYDDRWTKEPSADPEEYDVPAETVTAVREAKARGGRVIAVGTTVVRTLETLGLAGLQAEGGRHGWTNLYIHPGVQLQVVDGLLTGLHEPEASHLDMLSAFLSAEQIRRAYQEAVDLRYLWHEFGDMNLIL
jgi:S-adenosylmethionine:tRNA ribosyltransferase-isomerase